MSAAVCCHPAPSAGVCETIGNGISRWGGYKKAELSLAPDDQTVSGVVRTVSRLSASSRSLVPRVHRRFEFDSA